MTIGIDARIINNYVRDLIQNFLPYNTSNNYIIFFDSRVNRKTAKKLVGKHKHIKIKYFPFSRYRRFMRYAYSQILVSVFLKKQHLDILHATSGTMPIIYTGKKVLNLWKIEEKFKERILQKKIAKSASKIIVPTLALKRLIVKNYKIMPNRIVVLGNEPILNIYKEVVKAEKSK